MCNEHPTLCPEECPTEQRAMDAMRAYNRKWAPRDVYVTDTYIGFDGLPQHVVRKVR